MPLIRTIASGLLSRHTAKRIGRVIPNPILRYALVTAATAIVPVLVDRAVEAWNSRRASRNVPRVTRARRIGA